MYNCMGISVSAFFKVDSSREITRLSIKLYRFFILSVPAFLRIHTHVHRIYKNRHTR